MTRTTKWIPKSETLITLKDLDFEIQYIAYEDYTDEMPEYYATLKQVLYRGLPIMQALTEGRCFLDQNLAYINSLIDNDIEAYVTEKRAIEKEDYELRKL